MIPVSPVRKLRRAVAKECARNRRAVRIRPALVTFVFCCLRTPSTPGSGCGWGGRKGPDLGALGLGQKQVRRGKGRSHGERPRASRLSPSLRAGTPRGRSPPRALRPRGLAASAPRPAPAPRFPLRPRGAAPGRGAWVRSSPGVLGGPSFMCPFVHSTPPPGVDLDPCRPSLPWRPVHQDLVPRPLSVRPESSCRTARAAHAPPRTPCFLCRSPDPGLVSTAAPSVLA